ncbi:hypothetical protein A5768_02510 [Mycolicibacterium fortuitum]|nr:hypothetical protein A5768_02510 [Mycolicibacterium fortuitum]
MTEVQYAASMALVKDICGRYSIPLDRVHIIGHNEADPRNPHPLCPTGQWDWAYFMSTLTAPGPNEGTGDGTTGEFDTGEGPDAWAQQDEPDTYDLTDTWGTNEDAVATDDEPDTYDGTDTWATNDDPWGATDEPETYDGTDTWGTNDGTVATGEDQDTGDGADYWATNDDAYDDQAGDAPEYEVERILLRPKVTGAHTITRSAVRTIPARTAIGFHSKALDNGLLERLPMRPVWIRDFGPYLPTAPVPQLANPVKVGDYLVWPNSAQQQAYYTPASPCLRNIAVLIKREHVAVEGGTTTKVTGATAVITASAYAELSGDELTDLQTAWAQALIGAGHDDAERWRYLPLGFKALNGALAVPPANLDGAITTVSSPDAGTVTFSVPLSAVGALEWDHLIGESQPSLLQGVCTLTASYFVSKASLVDLKPHTITGSLGALLSTAGPAVLTATDPQTTVTTRVIVTTHDLVETATVDLFPRGGALPTSYLFNREGGQETLPVTLDDAGNATVEYTATVRYTPPGWPVIVHKGTLDYSQADWDVWIKPDSWLLEYDILTMLLDDQDRVVTIGPETANDTITVRLDYEHPALPKPLSLTFQAASQQLVTVPFPNPPGSPVPPTVGMTVLGVRGAIPVGPITRRLAYDENMSVIKAFAGGRLTTTTNKDVVAEGGRAAVGFNMIEAIRRAKDGRRDGRPTILAMSPSSAPESAGIRVTVTGRGLLGAVSVDFGDLSSPAFEVVDDAMITAEVPAGSGAVPVTVSTAVGVSEAFEFEYKTAPAQSARRITS